MLGSLCLITAVWSMSLQDAIQATLDHSPTVELSYAQVMEAESRIHSTRAGLLPELAASGGALWQNEIDFFLPDELDQDALNEAFDAADIPFVLDLDAMAEVLEPMVVIPGFQWIVKAEATQAILAPGLWLALRAAGAGASLARAEYQVRRYEITQTVLRAWHASARAHALVSEGQRAVETASEILSLARAVVENGVMAEDQIIPAREALSTARAGLARAQAAANAADSVLRMLSGIDDTADAPRVPSSIPPLDSMLGSISRPDVAAAGTRIEAAQAAYRATRAPALPVLGLSANVTFMDPAPEFADTWNWQVMLGITAPLFQGGKVSGQLDEAAARVSQARAAADAIQLQASIEVARTHGELSAAMASLEERERAVDLASQAVDAARTRFQHGSGSMLDLEQAQGKLLQARTGLTMARADAAMYSDLLKLSTGALP